MHTNEQLVRQFAYQIWESEGKPDGQAMRHWEMACILAEGQTGPADPMEPLTGSAAAIAKSTQTSKRKKAATPDEPKLLTGPAEHEVTMATAEPTITPPPTRVRVSAVIDDPASAPKKRVSTKDKTHKH